MRTTLLQLREDRFTIYQLLFLVLYALFLIPLKHDFKAVMQEHEQVFYLGLWGVVALVGDSWGSIAKSRYLAHAVFEPPKIVSVLMSFFFFCRIPMLLTGLYVMITAFSGNGDMTQGVNLLFLAIVGIWGLFVVIYSTMQMDGRKPRKLKGIQNEVVADFMLLFGGMFHFTAIWFVIPFEKMAADWPFFSMGERAEYVIGGLFLYLTVHGTTNWFHYSDRFHSAGSKKKQWLFAVNVLVTGITVIMYPVLFP